MDELVSRHNVLVAVKDALMAWSYMPEWRDEKILEAIAELPTVPPNIVRCKDCKHFEYDHVENVNGIPLIVAHEICTRWGDGVKTSENGYCFLAERKEVAA